jgi:uncharacterized protein YeaO (DUF488 family)
MGSRRGVKTRAYSSPACLAHESSAAAGVCVVRVKRIYDPRQRGDGFRVLVDRLWPRGVNKEAAHLHAWARELAPSTELRQWFHHAPSRWAQFRVRYRRELAAHVADLEGLRHLARTRGLTLLYAAKDREHNHALVLKEVVEAG